MATRPRPEERTWLELVIKRARTETGLGCLIAFTPGVGVASGDHRFEECLDRTASGLCEQEREECVNEAAECSARHRGAEPERGAHMLKVGFPNGFWVVLEESCQCHRLDLAAFRVRGVEVYYNRI